MSLVGGYSLNYFHWLTELLPGVLRLLPTLREDPALRVSCHNIAAVWVAFFSR